MQVRFRNKSAVGNGYRWWQAPVSVVSDQIVCPQTDGNHWSALHPISRRRHQAGQRLYEIWCKIQVVSPGADGLSHSLDIQVLEITDTAMNNFQAVR